MRGARQQGSAPTFPYILWTPPASLSPTCTSILASTQTSLPLFHCRENGVHVNSEENAGQRGGRGQWEPARLTSNPREPLPQRERPPGSAQPWPWGTHRLCKGPGEVRTSVLTPSRPAGQGEVFLLLRGSAELGARRRPLDRACQVVPQVRALRASLPSPVPGVSSLRDRGRGDSVGTALLLFLP